MMLKNLFTLNYWFELMPGVIGNSGKIFFLSLIIIFLLGAVLSSFYRRKGRLFKKTFSRLYDFFAGNFVLAIIFFFFRYETIPFLSARFWLALWFILIIGWLYFILKDLKGLDEKREEEKKRKEKEKYLP